MVIIDKENSMAKSTSLYETSGAGFCHLYPVDTTMFLC